MKIRLTLILVLLIYIGAASHTHAQQKKVIKTMMIAGQDGSHYTRLWWRHRYLQTRFPPI